MCGGLCDGNVKQRLIVGAVGAERERAVRYEELVQEGSARSAVRASVPRGADYESESAFSTPFPAGSAVVDSSVLVCLWCSYVEHSFRFHRYHISGERLHKIYTGKST